MRYVIVVAVVLALVLPQPAWSEDVKEIINMVRARESQLANVDFTLIERSSKDEQGSKSAIAAWKQAISVINVKFPQHSNTVPNLKATIKNLEFKYNDSNKYRISIRDDNEIAIQNRGGIKEDGPLLVSSYHSSQWHHYAPPHAKTVKTKSRLPNTGKMSISGTYVGTVSPFHILGLGPTIAADSDISAEITRNYKSLGFVRWADFFDLLAKQDYQSEQIAVTGDKVKIVFHRKANSKLGNGRYQYEVEFFAKMGYCPASFKSYQYIPATSSQEAYYIQKVACEWKNLIDFNGQKIPTEYVTFILHNIPVPSETTPFEDWKMKAIPVGLASYEIGDVKLNTEKVLHVTPVTGTHVFNEFTGVSYVVGSAGEALDVTANAVSNELLGDRRASTMMILLYFGAIVALLTCIGFAGFHFYKKWRLS